MAKRINKYNKLINKTKKLENTRNDKIRYTKKGKIDKRQTFKTVTQKYSNPQERLQAQQSINAYKLDKLRTTRIGKLSQTKLQK